MHAPQRAPGRAPQLCRDPCARAPPPQLKLPLLPVERFTRSNSSTSFFPRVEVLHAGEKLPERKGKKAQASSSPHFSFLSQRFVGQRECLCCVWIVVVHSKSSSSNMQRNEAGSSDGPQRTRLLHKSPFHSLFAKNFNTKLNCKVAY